MSWNRQRGSASAMLAMAGLVGVLALAPGICAAQSPSTGVGESAPEPSTQQKIAELKAAKEKLARQARETNGYHESLRQMKIVKIDKMIKRLENGEDIPQSKIEHTLSHMGFPLYNPNG
jgi:hypothetical protein